MTGAPANITPSSTKHPVPSCIHAGNVASRSFPHSRCQCAPSQIQETRSRIISHPILQCRSIFRRSRHPAIPHQLWHLFSSRNPGAYEDSASIQRSHRKRESFRDLSARFRKQIEDRTGLQSISPYNTHTTHAIDKRCCILYETAIRQPRKQRRIRKSRYATKISSS